VSRSASAAVGLACDIDRKFTRPGLHWMLSPDAPVAQLDRAPAF
jgi:hypothetical protein